jgi:hypothetical protein
MQKIIQSFFWGIFAAGFALILEIALKTLLEIFFFKNTLNLSLFDHFSIYIIIFASIEELSKYIIISKKINTLSDGKLSIIYAFFSGAGFSLLEFFFIYKFYSLENHILITLLQITILHISTFGIITYYLHQNRKNVILPILASIIIHTSYNFIVFNSEKMPSQIMLSFFLLIILINIRNLFTIQNKLAS